ncbi:M56 family peptidase [Phormidesmis priestleyi ULC007]|uniref:M56 family peptidase n=1 Tax=Phormidesmis priestleyi ULC007 TaxID=1920490 RepID=A0A2T1DB10_9CYAN|nr:M56 family metallopeptidase [Phormidesmis priestleyi]PSB17621.1 M56 family peptidase [Phormidesmis priestleyi ULC007]PZO48498.1 MAG: M56 family peptidase [Phormidesmis priestleyi]
MTHLIMLLLALTFAWGIRQTATIPTGGWSDRWHRTLGWFLFSPLLLCNTALALAYMGPCLHMALWWEGWGSYAIAISFLAAAIVLGLSLTIEAQRSLHQVRRYPQLEMHGKTTRLIEISTPYVAQIGFWQPELVVSQGLLQSLDSAHLEVVLVHEQGHLHYRDTFWFFWLGWLRRLTAWLPQTEALWQELLILRELRADRWAAQHVDSLLLAEALLSVVSAPQIQPENFCASFSSAVVRNRLNERINALLEPESSSLGGQSWWLLLVLLPLIVIPFHS